jgi:hypothetical protein
MNTLSRLPTRDPRIRAYRIPGTALGRPTTIHDIIRVRMAELASSADGTRTEGVGPRHIATH